MNGVHDMGGMHDIGAIEREKNEPVFQEPWEGRIWALRQALRHGANGTSMPPVTQIR